VAAGVLALGCCRLTCLLWRRTKGTRSGLCSVY